MQSMSRARLRVRNILNWHFLFNARRSVEHSTPHADGAPYISLAYLIYFRMIKFYLLPMLAKYGRGSISLQSPVTYQVETDQCKRSFESVTPDLPLFLLTTSR